MPYMSASIQFLDCRLSLLHIPLPLYNLFLHPILSLLLHPSSPSSPSSSFINISLTPVECSLVLPTYLYTSLFRPLLAALQSPAASSVSVSQDEFTAIQVDGDGLDASARLLDLTSPLALAGVPIFFITTYFSDYILVPTRLRGDVVRALQSRGFTFPEENGTAAGGANKNGIPSPNSRHPSHSRSVSSSVINPAPPPPAIAVETMEDLQARTSKLLAQPGVLIIPAEPTPASGRLVLCAGRRSLSTRHHHHHHHLLGNGAPPPDHHHHHHQHPYSSSSSTGDDYADTHTPLSSASSVRSSASSTSSQEDDLLYLGLVRALVATPAYLSLTLLPHEQPSLLLPLTLLPLFPDDALLGARDDTLVPLLLDLRAVDEGSTGIVCGVASRLIGHQGGAAAAANKEAAYAHAHVHPPMQMSYLSTARAGTVMVGEEERARAVDGLMNGGGGYGNGM